MLPKFHRSVAAVFLSVTLMSWFSPASAQPPERPSKLDNVLIASLLGDDATRHHVIIRVADRNPVALAALLRSQGDEPSRVHASIDGVAATLTVGQIRALTRLSSISSISTDAVVRANQSVTSGYTLRGTMGLPMQSPTGNRVGVAVIDSGLEPGPEFGDRIVVFQDFTRPGGSQTASDDYGHGTHVAGLIAAEGTLYQKRYRGMAPKARLIVLKVLDAHGEGKTSDVISAIEYTTANKARLGIDIINLSLGHPIFEPAATDPLVQAVEAAARAGIHVVTSAGNLGVNPQTSQPGYAGILSPANAPSAIAVGAVMTSDTPTRSDDTVTSYSSRGPSWYDATAKPDLVAPGHSMVSVAALASSLYPATRRLR